MPLIGGLRPRMAIFALTLYALLPILRNTLTGILAVDPAVRESAIAMGAAAAGELFSLFSAGDSVRRRAADNVRRDLGRRSRLARRLLHRELCRTVVWQRNGACRCRRMARVGPPSILWIDPRLDAAGTLHKRAAGK